MFTIFIMETVLIFGWSNMRYIDIDQTKEFDMLFLQEYIYFPQIYYLLCYDWDSLYEIPHSIALVPENIKVHIFLLTQIYIIIIYDLSILNYSVVSKITPKAIFGNLNIDIIVLHYFHICGPTSIFFNFCLFRVCLFNNLIFIGWIGLRIMAFYFTWKGMVLVYSLW